jgi:hypothetical protein
MMRYGPHVRMSVIAKIPTGTGSVFAAKKAAPKITVRRATATNKALISFAISHCLLDEDPFTMLSSIPQIGIATSFSRSS